MSFTLQRIRFSSRWQVKRSDGLIMAVFGTRGEAAAYCRLKNEEMRNA